MPITLQEMLLDIARNPGGEKEVLYTILYNTLEVES